MSVIAITHNPLIHLQTKHIDMKHHLIWDNIGKKHIGIEKVHTNMQIADIFVKPLSKIGSVCSTGFGITTT